MWPCLVDMTKDECKRVLRSMELVAYSHIVGVLRAQGALGPEKRKLLQDVGSAFNIPVERHKAEIRRAVNDEKLNTIAEIIVADTKVRHNKLPPEPTFSQLQVAMENNKTSLLAGPHTATEWAIEGRRLIPLIPRDPPRTMYALLADSGATIISTENTRLAQPSETANKGSDFPLITEPASPESSRTHDRSASPTGVLVLPFGTVLPVKREVEEEVVDRRKRKLSSSLQEGTPQQITPSNSKVMIVSSSGTPGTSSILQKTLSVPIKAVSAGGTPKSSVIYTQGVPGTLTTPTEQKIRSKPITAASIPKPRPSAIVVSNQPTTLSPQTIQLKSNKPVVTGVVTAVSSSGATYASNATYAKTALQTTKHTVPIQAITGVQVKGQPLERQPQTKILVQQKTLPRTVTKGLLHPGKVAGQKVLHTAGKAPPMGVVVQQKSTKAMVTNVQLKTPQGFTSVPIQLRAAGSKPQGLQIKHDPSNVKMLSISAGTKILPKPSQPLYMVASSTPGLSMVTRTIPASSSPRVVTMTTAAGTPVKSSQPGLFTPTKQLQTVHLMQTSTTPARRHQNVVLLQKGAGGLTKGSPIGQGTKVVVAKAPITVPKPVTGITSSTLAHSLGNLPMAQTQSGNVILLDLSSQESMTKNAAIAELLQASGLLGDPSSSEKTKRISTSIATEVKDDSDVQLLSEPDVKEEIKEEEVVIKEEELPAAITEGVTPGPTLSIEEAVEMLNRSDTPETRAILSQAGIQISDEIGDSEEEEAMESSEVAPNQVEEAPPVLKPIKKEEEVERGGTTGPGEGPNTSGGQDSAPAATSQPSHVTHTLPLTVQTRSNRMDIFSTALASADINLDNFMEEEDEPEQMLTEVSPSPKIEDTPTTRSRVQQEASSGESTDPIELQLAQLTEDTET